jgi:hypothetical protein
MRRLDKELSLALARIDKCPPLFPDDYSPLPQESTKPWVGSYDCEKGMKGCSRPVQDISDKEGGSYKDFALSTLGRIMKLGSHSCMPPLILNYGNLQWLNDSDVLE